MIEVRTVDPRSGEARGIGVGESTPDEVAAIVRAAADAAPELEGFGREGRAVLLDAVAERLDARRSQLIAMAEAETGLDAARLDGELTRSVLQFRLFGDVLRDGGYLEAAIDHAVDSPTGRAPDVRRMLVPIGPVAVFGASNFPFAFSVAGGDTASALAAGCPVLLKAHPSHPSTSLASAEAIAEGVRAAGAPEAALGLVFGVEAGVRLVQAPEVRAVALTGSVRAARALQAAIDERPDPIPLYGELGSVNPLVILPRAAAVDAERIATGLFGSFTGSGGQLCTKPGLAFVPAGADGDRLVAALADRVAGAEGAVLLNEGIRDAFVTGTARLEDAGARLVARGSAPAGTGYFAAPTLVEVAVPALSPEIAEECFGPLLVIVRYDSIEEVAAAVDSLPASLTATLHAAADEDAAVVADLARRFERRAGRIVFNGFPTGVRVSWAQHHGGPWPATNSLHTSVGTTAIRRFLRPLAWQDAPENLLPPELRDGAAPIPRRIDGRLELGRP